MSQLHDSSRLAELEREVERLKSEVDLLFSLIDREELLAMQRLKEITPSTAKLREWTEASIPPSDLADLPDEWS